MDTKIILGQVFGIAATVLLCLSYQTNSKGKLLLMQTAGCAATCLSYLFLGAMSGFALNVVCVARNGIFYFLPAKSQKALITGFVIAGVMAIVGGLSWQGAVSLIIISALMINTVCMSTGDPQLLRKSILLTSTMVIIYNIFVFSLGGICAEGLSIISAATGIIRYKNKK